MHTFTKLDDMQGWAKKNSSQGNSIGFVPTMGFLHAGHLSLMRQARQENAKVVVSVFVNPLQFAPHEDYAQYPRDNQGDANKIAELGGDVLFLATAEEMYPKDFSTYVVPQGLTEKWEGVARPGHFRGVATVVLKLFQLITPTRAYFGRKDAQQLAVIQRMVRDFHLPITIVPCPIVREADGLAMSSRNVLLSAAQRQQALTLHRALRGAQQLFQHGGQDVQELMHAAKQEFASSSQVALDYLAIVDPNTWEECHGRIKRGLMIVAAKVGQIRLLDNLLLE